MLIRLTSIGSCGWEGGSITFTTATMKCDACAEDVVISGRGGDVYDTEPTRLALLYC
jgi:hypothetical protein